ncbi:MAG: hypothetical protein FJW40_20665, partial [Acidobacteria bacterium]|nr:hypothetical protein [Acidobacteriota bacterium]
MFRRWFLTQSPPLPSRARLEAVLAARLARG